MLIAKFSKKATTFVAIDKTIKINYQTQYENLLHSLNPAGLFPYKLTLKENCVKMQISQF